MISPCFWNIYGITPNQPQNRINRSNRRNGFMRQGTVPVPVRDIEFSFAERTVVLVAANARRGRRGPLAVRNAAVMGPGQAVWLFSPG